MVAGGWWVLGGGIPVWQTAFQCFQRTRKLANKQTNNKYHYSDLHMQADTYVTHTAQGKLIASKKYLEN